MKSYNKSEPNQKDVDSILKMLTSNNIINAKSEIEKLIVEYPKSSILYNLLGAIFAVQKNSEYAIHNYKTAIKINPTYAQAYNNLGAIYHKSKKMSEAIINYKKAISLKHDFAEANNNLGNAMRELGMPEEALPYFEKALKINSDYFEAYFNLGEAYQELGNREDAIINYEKAIKINPNHAEIYNNYGMMLYESGKINEAKKKYLKAISLNPNNEKFHNNIGNLLSQTDLDKGILSYNRAIQLKSDYAIAYSNLLFNLNFNPKFDINFYLTTAKKFSINCKSPQTEIPSKYFYKKKPDKLKLGLVSSDFGKHPGGYFTLSTLKELIKSNFELVAYSNYDRNDEFSEQFKPLFNNWYSIKKKNDEEVVKQILKDGIHILMDLQGHSGHNRLPIFIYKPAPIQASWLAQGSTGISEIDYFIGSHHITPKNEEKHFVEKILRLPEISQCFTTPNYNLEINSLPLIKNNFVTFGCVNNLSKINEQVISVWSKILSAVPNSKLLLKTKNFDQGEEIVKEFISKFEKNDINKNRLILKGGSKTREDLLKVYHEIDFCLDPFPYQGNTTTIESVWMGVPVLTLKGNRYLFHFGESINNNLKMDDWIAKDYNEYISKAIKFSLNPEKLSELRSKLRKIALESPVLDAPRFAKNFSKLLWDIWNKYEKKF